MLWISIYSAVHFHRLSNSSSHKKGATGAKSSKSHLCDECFPYRGLCCVKQKRHFAESVLCKAPLLYGYYETTFFIFCQYPFFIFYIFYILQLLHILQCLRQRHSADPQHIKKRHHPVGDTHHKYHLRNIPYAEIEGKPAV